MNQNNNYNFDPMTGQPINQQVQQPIQNQSTTNMYSQVQQPIQPTINISGQPIQSQQSKKKNNIKMLIIILVVAVVLVGGIIFVPKLFGTKEKNNLSEILTDSNVFWIQNNEYLYALFDIHGNQLTEFQFKDVGSEFVNGTSRVSNNNGEYGLISSTGKMIVEFGKYKYIFDLGAVYEMTDSDYNKYLYSSSGKLIRQLNDEINENVELLFSQDIYSLIESDIDYKIVDHNGKEILSIPISEDAGDSPKIDGLDNYISIFYNNVTYIIDISKGKVLLNIPDSRSFCVRNINEENIEEFILATCNASYKDESNSEFKVIRDGKIAYSKKASVSYASMWFDGNNVVYEDKDDYLLDENGNEKIKLNIYINYKDYKNYVKLADGILNGAELYVNGSLKEKLECNNIQGGYAKHGVYLLDHCSGFGNGNKIYMNADGTRINDKAYEYAYEFDENGYASVSEDGENYYLINLDGEKVSDYYSDNRTAEKIYNVTGTDNLYYGTNEDGTTTIFEINGKKLLTGNFIWPTGEIKADGEFVIIEKDNKYIMHNLITGKDIVTLNSEPYMYLEYFTTSENSRTQYYSYTTGKLFHEE